MSVLTSDWGLATAESEVDENHTDWSNAGRSRMASLTSYFFRRHASSHKDVLVIVSQDIQGSACEKLGSPIVSVELWTNLMIKRIAEELQSLADSENELRTTLRLALESSIVSAMPLSSAFGVWLHVLQSWPSADPVGRPEDVVEASYEVLKAESVGSVTKEEDVWAQKTVPELIELLGQFETDRRSANIAAAMLEHVKVSKEEKPQLKLALRAFISGSKLSKREQDQVALRCAMRRYVYIQGDAVYEEVERLLWELEQSEGPPANSVELLITFAEFLWIRTPPTVVDSTPGLVAALQERCETSLVGHLLAFVDVRVIAIQSLLALILMGRSEAEALIDKAMRLGPAQRYLSQRAEDLMAKLMAQGAGSPETRALLERVLGAGGV